MLKWSLMEPEKTFLLDACRAFVNGRWPAGSPRVPLCDLDWMHVISCAYSHRILPFVTVALQHFGRFEEVPQDIRCLLTDDLNNAAAVNLKMMTGMGRLAQAFHAHSLRFVPLKGAGLTPLVYSQHSYRHMVDLDFLVPPFELNKAIGLLRQLGFELKYMRNRWQAELLSRAWGRAHYASRYWEVDLQWNPRYLISGRWLVPDWEHIWRRTIPPSDPGSAVSQLAPPDLAAHLAIQVVNDLHTHIPQMLQLLDLALVCRRFGIPWSSMGAGDGWPLDPGQRQALGPLVKTMRAIWHTDEPYAGLDEEVRALLDRHFLTPCAWKQPPRLALSKQLSRRRDRLIYLAGYFLPSHGQLRNMTGAQSVNIYLRHWVRLLRRVAERVSQGNCQSPSKNPVSPL